MHAFDFTLFVWIFWIAVILLILSALGLVFLGPNIQGAVANWLCWLLAIVAAACSLVVFVLGGIWLKYGF